MAAIKSFNSKHSTIVMRQKISTIQKFTVLEYKKDTDSNSNIMPVNVFKVPFPKSSYERTNQFQKQNVILYKYNN